MLDYKSISAAEQAEKTRPGKMIQTSGFGFLARRCPTGNIAQR